VRYGSGSHLDVVPVSRDYQYGAVGPIAANGRFRALHAAALLVKWRQSGACDGSCACRHFWRSLGLAPNLEASMTDDKSADEFADQPTPTDEVIHVCRIPQQVGLISEIWRCTCGELYVRRGYGLFCTWERMQWLDRLLNRRKLASMGYR
jgi:hypothetical protein